jgi:hypothetical protein
VKYFGKPEEIHIRGFPPIRQKNDEWMGHEEL